MSKYVVSREECSKHNIFPGVDIFTTAGERMMLSFVEFEPHAVVEMHSHPHEQIVNVLEGTLELIVAGTPHVLNAGDVFVIPGGVPHACVAHAPTRVLDVFSPVREEYR